MLSSPLQIFSKKYFRLKDYKSSKQSDLSFRNWHRAERGKNNDNIFFKNKILSNNVSEKTWKTVYCKNPIFGPKHN